MGTLGFTANEFGDSGVGLRRTMLTTNNLPAADFYEVAPENWIQVHGPFRQQLGAISEQSPIVAHGLSLSIGGVAPLQTKLVREVGAFLNEFNISCYSEHLSYTDDGGQLYDLLPLPFTWEAVQHVSRRILQVQDILKRRIALENISYYATPAREMTELEFVTAVLEEADCDLLLDVNNVYVNSQNHGYDAHDYIANIPTTKVRYLHVAGHYVEDDGFIVDTHGAEVVDPVWQLLGHTYQIHGHQATLLERDFNIPNKAELSVELATIKSLQEEIGNAAAA